MSAGKGKRPVGEFGEELASEIRAEIARQKITPTVMTREAGIPTSTLSRLVAGTRVIDVRQLAAISGALHVQPNELVRRAEEAVLRRSALDKGASPETLGGQAGDDPA